MDHGRRSSEGPGADGDRGGELAKITTTPERQHSTYLNSCPDGMGAGTAEPGVRHYPSGTHPHQESNHGKSYARTYERRASISGI